MYGRDALGDKELKKLSRSSNESFIKSIKKTLKAGGASVIMEGKSMMDEENIIQ
jgi:phosphosulfolactate synthase (CoM biosynthesis protein A)